MKTVTLEKLKKLYIKKVIEYNKIKNSQLDYEQNLKMTLEAEINLLKITIKALQNDHSQLNALLQN